MSNFKHTCGQELPVEIDILFSGRRRVTRRFELGKDGNIDDIIFSVYGADDPGYITACTTGYADLKLITQKIQPGQDPKRPQLLVQVFETLTSALAQETRDTIDYDLNGLKRTTRQLIALPSVNLSAYVVGAQVFGASPTQTLATLKAEQNDALTRVTAVYLAPGVLSKSRRPGEITGTVAETWDTWMVDPTDATAMTAAGAGAALTGSVIADQTGNVQGFPTRSVTVLTGTITGTKTTYKDAIEVRTPGSVTLVLVEVGISGASGSVAVINHVPPRVKTVYATVTVAVTTTPPNSGDQLAYNLEGISCSVTSTGASYRELGSDTFTTVGGNASITGRKASMSIDASISTFPGCFCPSTSQTGTVTYTGAYEPSPANLSGTSIVMTGLTSTSKNTLTPSGATAAGASEGYYITGIIQRKARPILTTLAGVVYWEVVTWTA